MGGRETKGELRLKEVAQENPPIPGYIAFPKRYPDGALWKFHGGYPKRNLERAKEISANPVNTSTKFKS